MRRLLYSQTKDMKPEFLLKAYVEHQSEDAFRELVTSTLDEVYSGALRTVDGAQHLAEEIALSVYSELARKASRLSKDVVLASWLRERTCKIAVGVLRAEERTIDWAALKREKDLRSAPAGVEPAPPGLAIRICRDVFLSAARRKGHGFSLPRLSWPAWVRPKHVWGVAVCVLVMIVWWKIPFHRHNPIIRSQGGSTITPSSFAQLASPEETRGPVANTNAGTNTKPK